MITLGIETSTNLCSVGIADESNLKIEKSILDSHIHSEKLLTLINDVCKEKNIVVQDLDAIGISIGPGSFTGLRIGLSTAKGLCYSINKPIIEVKTFYAVANSVFNSESIRNNQNIAICLDAKQNEYYFNVFNIQNGCLNEIVATQLINFAELLSYFKNDVETIVVTDLPKEIYKDIKNLTIIDYIKYCNGYNIAKIALSNFKNNKINSISDAEPYYIKNFVVKK